jgi:hypothetical protein
MQSVPQRLLSSSERDLGEPLSAGLESMREEGAMYEVNPNHKAGYDTMYPTTAESIRDLLKQMRNRPFGPDAIGIPRQ